MYLLAIETSCDDTSLAIYDTVNRSFLASETFSQNDHNQFGGVIPEISSRNHLAKISPLYKRVLKTSGITTDQLSGIAVTNQPGLVGALFVGVSFAKSLGYALQIPVYPVNHIYAHILSAEIDSSLTAPYLALVVSGGHTHLFYVDAEYNFTLLSRTMDDAAGEAFDKVSKLLNGPYPGGAFVEKLAKDGNENSIPFKVPMLNEKNFSFSGLKTAVKQSVSNSTRENIAASFQKTVVDSIESKLEHFLSTTGVQSVSVTGGVAVHGYLQSRLNSRFGANVIFPKNSLCSDNAEMIAYAAHKLSSIGKIVPSDSSLTAYARVDFLEHITETL